MTRFEIWLFTVNQIQLRGFRTRALGTLFHKTGQVAGLHRQRGEVVVTSLPRLRWNEEEIEGIRIGSGMLGYCVTYRSPTPQHKHGMTS